MEEEMKVKDAEETIPITANKDVAKAVKRYIKATGKEVIFSTHSSDKPKDPDKEIVLYAPDPSDRNAIFNVVRELTERTHTDSLDPEKMYSAEINENVIERKILPFLNARYPGNPNLKSLANEWAQDLLTRIISYPRIISVMHEVAERYPDLDEELEHLLREIAISASEFFTADKEANLPDKVYKGLSSLNVALILLLKDIGLRKCVRAKKILIIGRNNLSVKRLSTDLYNIFTSPKYTEPRFVYYGVIAKAWARSLGLNSWFTWKRGTSKNPD